MNLTAEFWYWFFLGLILFNYFFSNILELINSKNWKTHIPDEVKDFYDEKKYIKAREYKIETGRISFFSGTISFLISFGLIWFKGFGYISNYIDLYFIHVTSSHQLCEGFFATTSAPPHLREE